MKALCWHGKGVVRVDDVPDPRILEPTDAILTHKVGLQQAPEMYKTFRDKQDGCVKVMLQPNGAYHG